MSAMLFRDDPYLKRAPATVLGHTDEGGLILDQCLFYPTGGGQPGDSGRLDWAGGSVVVATTIKGKGEDIVLVPGAPEAMPAVGDAVMQVLDWDRRHAHMRVHTALHLLSVAVPLPVNGGSIGAEKGRLDFDMPDAVIDKEALCDTLNNLIMRDLDVIESWISDAELLANPSLVKTMAVRPPTGQGRVRMIAIGQGDGRIDYQPCGGTHVARTSEVGVVRIGKIQNKGRQNRRINVHLDGYGMPP